MGRWRPPQKPSSPYITPEGARDLKEELQYLWRKLRPEVVKALSAAAAEGDRSENAEYIYRKKQLGEIDRRVRYLTKRLDVIQIVDRLPDEQDRVRFGAWVTVIDADDHEVTWRIVGADETSAGKGWISIDSPMARSLLGKGEGDTVQVEIPSGSGFFEITGVRYGE
jgi:transcription elongation factor GreB